MMNPALLWQQLESHLPGPVRLNMLPCSETAPVFAGLLRAPDGASTARMLLLKVPRYLASNTRLREQPKGLVLEALEHPDEPQMAYVSLRLTEPDLDDLFAVLAYDIAETVVKMPDAMEQLKGFIARIAGWQELFGRVLAGGLTAIARQGLYGELFLLRRLLSAGLQPGKVLPAWVGPYRAPQDFRSDDIAVEVKTTAGNGQAVHISNADQLDDTRLEALWLFHLVLLIGPEDGETLPEIIAGLTALLEPEPETAALFQGRLQLAGYFHAQADLYGTERFAVQQEHTIRVTGTLPRLRASDMAAAIGSVTYTIELAALLPFRQPFSALTDSLS